MIDASTAAQLRDNWRKVCDEVAKAAMASGRRAEDVQVIGVSKYVDAETTGALFAAGCHALGESRPQQLWSKAETLALGDRVRWHLIGHLQRNKLRRTLRWDPVVHSVDSKRLLESIAAEAAQQDRRADVLLEVNISGDEAKTGFAPNQLEPVIASLPSGGVRVRGLMAMAGWGTDPDDARRQFARTRQLRDELAAATGCDLTELSMGMSGDFVAAIAEGATMVRIGSRLFTGIESP
jgi:pyridoxal phosphate enzyme (YggS family)